MNDRVDPLFPRDLCGRVALALVGIVFGPICWLGFVAFCFGQRPIPGFLGLILWLILEEVFLALSLFFTCGLVWAIATPRWLERLLDHVVTKLAYALGLGMIPFLVLAIWGLMVG